MISRNQTALSRLRFIACSVFMTLEFIVICWELHGMRSELRQQSQLQQRSLHDTGQASSEYRGWLSLTLPSMLACSVAGHHLLKKLSKNIGRPHNVINMAPDRKPLKTSRGPTNLPTAASNRSEVPIGANAGYYPLLTRPELPSRRRRRNHALENSQNSSWTLEAKQTQRHSHFPSQSTVAMPKVMAIVEWLRG